MKKMRTLENEKKDEDFLNIYLKTYGLYSAFAGSFVYIIFGSCKEVNIGPTALLSLLTASYTQGTHPDMAVLLCFLSGCVELLCGVFQLGFLVDFVSAPVVAGFTSAAALIIACSQLKGLLGLSFSAHGFLDTWIQLARLAHRFQVGDLALGACCIVTLLSLRQLKDVKLRRCAGGEAAGESEGEGDGDGEGKAKAKAKRPWGERALWFISTARNAMVVVTCAAIAYALEAQGTLPFMLAGHIDAGLPVVSPPPFETSWSNRTYTFPEMVARLGSGVAVVPVVAILGNVAIAKAFASGARVDATQEMVTLGLCNVAGSFFRSMPVCGSFSRSAVNNASGVRTPLGGLYTERDLVPAFATFLACLFFGVEVGIVVGIAADPEAGAGGGGGARNGLPSLEAALSSAAAPAPATALAPSPAPASAPSPVALPPLVVSCAHMQRADFTAAQGLRALVADLRRAGRSVIFAKTRRTLLP
ncbi:Sodium-independent sulfate anion transporter [Gryllus bimaculatus]|nr:Sodium-independent sulfate anion transporter [Gryllus bimaculatus]